MLRTFFTMHMQRSAIAAIALAVTALAPARASAQFGSIFFFGDSFTDVGSAVGLAALNSLPNPAPSPPYAPGRFSNGAIYSEMLAAKFGRANDATSAWVGTGNNYAVGGASTGQLGALGSLTGMASQVAKFTADHANPALIAPNSLFVLFGGGNDVTDAVALSDPAARLAAITTAATNVTTLAGYLAQNYGARNFLIPLLPDVGTSPMYAADPVGAAIATSLTNTFNALLTAGLQSLNVLPGINVRTLNFNNIVTNIKIDAANGGTLYGITNLTTPCFTPTNPPIACSSSLFVDTKHPTTKVEQLLADAAYTRLTTGADVAVIPEPSTILLMAAGLGMVAVASSKRKKEG